MPSPNPPQPTAARDYVTTGVARLPALGRGTNTVRYLSVYLAQLAAQEATAVEVLDAISQWWTGATPPAWALEIVGRLVGQPRPDGFTDAEYLFVIRARCIARVSMADLTSVVRLVAWLANGSAYSVWGSAPEHWTIVFTDLDLTAQWQAVYASLLLDTIGATDSLSVTYADGGTALYDSEISGYDLGVYA